MQIGVPKETADGERRVALVPEVVKKLKAKDVDVLLQRGAGDAALIPDSQYEEAGATLTDDAAQVFASDAVVKVAPPTAEEAAQLKPQGVLIGFLQPLTNG